MNSGKSSVLKSDKKIYAMFDPGILCFQHCRKDAKIFCFELPKTCEICGGDLQTTELRIPPFRIPSPFFSAKKNPCCVVIKPTVGDFLHSYQNSSDLHIGITDSKGMVYEYDMDGLKVTQGQEWNECLVIPVTKKVDTTWKEFWDYTLCIIYQQDKWQSERYNEEMHNCYMFVMAFLRTLQIQELKPSLGSKTQFCKDFIIPHTRAAAKYITLYRKLRKERVSVQR